VQRINQALVQVQQSGRLALRWQWRAASALSAGAGGDADHIARFLSLALPLDLQGQWSALCTHQIAAWRAPISRTGSRLMPTMTATMPKFSRQARVRTFDGTTLPIEHGDALATFARRRRRIHRVHFFGAVSVWRDRAGAAHCTLYTDKLDHLPDIGQHGAHPFLTTPPRDHVRHAIHRSKAARSKLARPPALLITRSAAMAMQLRWRLMPSRSLVSATFVQLACNHSHHDPRWLATR